MSKKIAIIGGGIAGLSAGCYGQMNGFATEIFEMHTVPGGVCTGWKRKDYIFDGCLHWLTGSAPSHPYYKIWEELGAIKGKRIINHSEFAHIILPSGRRLVQYTDIRTLVGYLKKEFPEDSKALDVLESDVLTMSDLRMPVRSAKPAGLFKKIRGLLKFSKYLPVFSRYSGTLADFVAKFKCPELRQFFTAFLPFPDMPGTHCVSLLAMLSAGESGWPEGGSLALAKSIEQRYKELGGKIHYGARVKEITVKNNRAAGVRLEDGSEHVADQVIGAADGRSTIFSMLKGKYATKKIRKDYQEMPLYTPLMQVSFGVKRDLSELPRLTTYCLSKPLMAGGTPVSWLFLNNYAFDHTMADRGKTALTVMFWSEYDHWSKFTNDRQAYLAEKKKVQEDITAWLESVLPGISADIEVTDVATPLTTVRYTGNYRASYEGFRPTVASMRRKLSKRLPGLSNFRMIGQWTAPFSGLPTVTLDGRLAIEELCLAEGKSFATSKAN